MMRKIEASIGTEPLTMERDERLMEEQRSRMFVDCYTYVFKIVEGDSWTRADESDFIESPVTFLTSRGYAEVEEPVTGDIVLYAHDTSGATNPPMDTIDKNAFYKAQRTERPYVAHAGIYCEDGRVVSKFGSSGPLHRHKLEEIPPMYGNQVYFFRRAKTPDEGL